MFYTLYFQAAGKAEAEFERDVRIKLRKLLFADSGEAGPRMSGDGTPNQFSMVSRTDGLLASLPFPTALPFWLTEGELSKHVISFDNSGFRGGLNYYRNLDRNWELPACFGGGNVTISALFLIGERDVGLSIPRDGADHRGHTEIGAVAPPDGHASSTRALDPAGEARGVQQDLDFVLAEHLIARSPGRK